jgi:plasmid stabilization system protein ParE
MSQYIISYSDEANRDLENLAYTISENYSSPLTAFRYVQGIIETINQMAKNPEAYPVRFNFSLLQYGINVRRINYKKMAIIYTVNNDIVYIHRIIASSLITDL